MNRLKRDYCSKGYHPAWKAWTAKYDMSTIHWKWLGEYCKFCGAKVKTTVGGGPKEAGEYARLMVLRGIVRTSTK